MADIHEVLITAELPAELSEAEMAELRWHLGLGARPGALVIVVDHWPVHPVGEEHGDPLPGDQWEVDAYPLLAQRGPVDRRVGGVAYAELARREGGGWALSSRQVVHSDELGLMGGLLSWLRERAERRWGEVEVRCHVRFCEDGPGLRVVSSFEGGAW
ncbi:hypothetical protein [Streptomyces sp. NPDC127108]|uniref:hypothetical protein n=1 Tax=Streptomyces sp. NPDC127108 TaxID=3345361 RepID=UPI00363B146F